MKRSTAVHLVVLASAVVTLEGCGNRQCVDANNIVVDDQNCHTSSIGYHYYSGGSGSAPVGSSADAPGTSRGVFGSAGDSAARGSGGAGGEGAGAGE